MPHYNRTASLIECKVGATPMALKFLALFLASGSAQGMTDEESDAIIKMRWEKRLKHQKEMLNMTRPETSVCNPDFVDSEGFDCQLYELGNWCNGEASPRGFGKEWCQRSSSCASQGFNWGSFSIFSVAKGREEADNQCSGCGAKSCPKNYKRAIPDYPEGCVDYETVKENGGGVWSDSWGYSCHAYSKGQFCKQKPDGTWTEGGLWPVSDFGKIKGYSWFHKGCTKGRSCRIDAFTACCSCGGGTKSNQTGLVTV